MALPRLLDRERCFGLARELLAERAQLRHPAQGAIDEVAVHYAVEPARELGVIPDALIRYRAAEAIAPALCVEPQQMVAISVGAINPDLADHAVNQGLVHRVSCSSFRRMPPWLLRGLTRFARQCC